MPREGLRSDLSSNGFNVTLERQCSHLVCSICQDVTQLRCDGDGDGAPSFMARRTAVRVTTAHAWLCSAAVPFGCCHGASSHAVTSSPCARVRRRPRGCPAVLRSAPTPRGGSGRRLSFYRWVFRGGGGRFMCGVKRVGGRVGVRGGGVGSCAGAKRVGGRVPLALCWPRGAFVVLRASARGQEVPCVPPLPPPWAAHNGPPGPLSVP